jgi:hypothetical protein
VARALCHFGVIGVRAMRKARRSPEEEPGEGPVVRRSSGGRLWNW